MTTDDRLRTILAEAVQHFDDLPPLTITWATPEEIAARAGGPAWAAVLTTAWGDGLAHIAIDGSLRRAPKYVLLYLVVHELLHQKHGKRGREWHHKAFRISCRLWPGYRKATEWLNRKAARG